MDAEHLLILLCLFLFNPFEGSRRGGSAWRRLGWMGWEYVGFPPPHNDGGVPWSEYRT